MIYLAFNDSTRLDGQTEFVSIKTNIASVELPKVHLIRNIFEAGKIVV